MNVDRLKKMGACPEAVEWASRQKTRQQAWDACDRGDWMLWLLGRTYNKQGSPNHRKLVLCACAVARTALKYVPKGERRPLAAIETAESWARNDGATLDEVRASADAASAAYAAAADAAYAAFVAAHVAYHAAHVAASAFAASSSCAATATAHAYAAYHAAAYASASASYAYAADLLGSSLAKSAKIVRKYFPKPPRWRAKS